VSAGSLSYGDNDKVLDEIYRVLKNKGAFIAIDSLNNNPKYMALSKATSTHQY
jgi:ubiquinone/menaquinone biosynthesis C-methylase UbiE